MKKRLSRGRRLISSYGLFKRGDGEVLLFVASELGIEEIGVLEGVVRRDIDILHRDA